MRYLRPLFDQIVVKEQDPPEMRRSGLVMPAEAAKGGRPPQEGVVIAVGPGIDWWAHAGVEMPVRAGDLVMFPFNAGVYVEVEEEKLLVLRAGQLLGVVEEGSAREGLLHRSARDADGL